MSEPSRAELEARVAELLARVAELEAEVAQHRARRTLGGIPPGYHEPGAWANVASRPPSADDAAAPPLQDRRGR